MDSPAKVCWILQLQTVRLSVNVVWYVVLAMICRYVVCLFCKASGHEERRKDKWNVAFSKLRSCPRLPGCWRTVGSFTQSWVARRKHVGCKWEKGTRGFIHFFNVCTDVFILYHLWCNQISIHTCTLPFPLSLVIHPSLLAPFFGELGGLGFAKSCMLFVLSHFPLCLVGLLSHDDRDLSLQGRVCMFFCGVPWDVQFNRDICIFFKLNENTISYLWNGLMSSHRLKSTQKKAWTMLLLRICSFCCNFVFALWESEWFLVKPFT